mmetsp:Transcript_65924/g.73801  ORF Transcript_65924/g.73801 Transcript_65924/m.73801 type:complete len:373 (-) Transcript_65924:176-1294(-)
MMDQQHCRSRSSLPIMSRSMQLPCRFPSSLLLLIVLLLSRTEILLSLGFMNPTTRRSTISMIPGKETRSNVVFFKSSTSSTTSLNVWWFGGSERSERNNNSVNNDESCELVAVRIERPTSNSRRIMGEISIPGVVVDDVWSILTDYNRLSIHVPNLKESTVVQENNRPAEKSTPGDGSYKCQLYQVGAQNIIGLDFSASVTMDMTERILTASTSNARKIYFKCVDSQFFSEFDGSWTVQQQIDSRTGEKEVLCSYDVMVRPKGPVPVAALEWRIREDVPTNLRAVKAATLVMTTTPTTATTTAITVNPSLDINTAAVNDDNYASSSSSLSSSYKTRNSVTAATATRMATKRAQQMAVVMVDWEQGETMGKYL